MSNGKASSVSIRDLHNKVQEAAKAAGIKETPNLVLGPWIWGYILRQRINDLGQLEQIAQQSAHTIAPALGGGAVHGGIAEGARQPVQGSFLFHGGHLIMGFVAPEQIIEFRE